MNTNSRLPEPMLTVREVSQILNVCLSHVYDMIAIGTIRSIRIGRSIRITRSELERFIAAESDRGPATQEGDDA